MSDNLTEQEVRRRLIIFLRIPTEVWTDVLKLFPRRTLVQKIAPVCFRLKEISDKNVKSVHVIENTKQFKSKLEADDPEAIQQLEHLAGNKCQLAGQFRFTILRISEKNQAILHHCPELFNGCQIRWHFKDKNKDSTFFLECLRQLEKAKPFAISVHQDADQIVDFWHNPTFKNCSRIDLFFRPSLSNATMMMMNAFENIFSWLHLQPMGKDYNSPADRQVRSMIFWSHRIGYNYIDWLIDRCSEDIRLAREPADRRSYVFSIQSWDWPGFDRFRPIENKSTGEMLLLARVMRDNGEPAGQYRLRRCLAEEVANGPEFYAKLFKPYRGYAEFELEEKTRP